VEALQAIERVLELADCGLALPRVQAIDVEIKPQGKKPAISPIPTSTRSEVG